jgi:NAD(P)-dependent dehydrogenase (short-subunit alcohol dehydrogenase family)
VDQMNDSLARRVASLTGGGPGIGRAVGVGLAAAGARVAVLACTVDQLARTGNLAGDAGEPLPAVPADEGEASQVVAALDAMRRQCGLPKLGIRNRNRAETGGSRDQ